MAAVDAGSPAPRLLSGPEQDLVLRELLVGDLERGHWLWPAELRAALRTRAFAGELRDLLLRAVERGLSGPRAGRARPSPRPAGLGSGRRLPARVPGRDVTRSARRVGPGGADPGRDERAAATTRPCWPPSAAGAGTSSSTSTRTPTRRRSSCCTCWPTAPTSSWSSATRISRSTPSAERDASARSGCRRPLRRRGRRPGRRAASLRAGAAPRLLAASRRIAPRLPGRGAAPRARPRPRGLPPGQVDVAVLRTAGEEAGYVAERAAPRPPGAACPGRGWRCSCDRRPPRWPPCAAR